MSKSYKEITERISGNVRELSKVKPELAEVLGVCIYMGGGPKLMYAAEAMQAFEEFKAG